MDVGKFLAVGTIGLMFIGFVSTLLKTLHKLIIVKHRCTGRTEAIVTGYGPTGYQAGLYEINLHYNIGGMDFFPTILCKETEMYIIQRAGSIEMWYNPNLPSECFSPYHSYDEELVIWTIVATLFTGILLVVFAISD